MDLSNFGIASPPINTDLSAAVLHMGYVGKVPSSSSMYLEAA